MHKDEPAKARVSIRKWGMGQRQYVAICLRDLFLRGGGGKLVQLDDSVVRIALVVMAMCAALSRCGKAMGPEQTAPNLSAIVLGPCQGRARLWQAVAV